MLCHFNDDRIAFHNKMKIEYSILNIEQLTGLKINYMMIDTSTNLSLSLPFDEGKFPDSNITFIK